MPSPFPKSQGEEVFPAQLSSPCQTSRAAELFVQAGSGGSGAAHVSHGAPGALGKQPLPGVIPDTKAAPRLGMGELPAPHKQRGGS